MKFNGQQFNGEEVEMFGTLEEIRLFCKKNLRRYERGVIFDDNNKAIWIFYRQFEKIQWAKV